MDARQRYSTLLWRLVSSGQWERVLGVAGDWLTEEPAATEAHQAAGQALVNLRRYEPALEHLRRALAATPDHGFVHRLASIAYFHLGLFPRADGHIMEAIRLQPRDAMHWYHLALMGYKHGHYEAAAGYARRSLELLPDNADAVNLLALCERTNASQRLVHYQHALALDPENATVHNNVGVYHLNAPRDYAAAADSFRRALAIQPADLDAQRNLVLAFRLGDPWHVFLRFPKRFFAVLSFRPGTYTVRTLVWFGLCVCLGGMPFAMLLAIYGAWVACGLPLLKAYEAVTLPDLRERAGIPGARRGGPLRFWRWPRWARVGGLFASYAACGYMVVMLAKRFDPVVFLLGAGALGALVTAFHGGRAGWQAARRWWQRRRMEKKFRHVSTAAPTTP